jgi:hypothetical protein
MWPILVWARSYYSLGGYMEVKNFIAISRLKGIFIFSFIKATVSNSPHITNAYDKPCQGYIIAT